MAITIYYDGECPFCARYVKLLRLREAAGPVRLVDLRADPDLRCRLVGEGFDLDEGFVVDLQDRRLGGADAAHALATLSTPSTLLNRVNRILLGHPLMASITYPVLRSGRWLALFLLGRQGFERQEEGTQARAAIFSIFFALFSIFSFLNYATEYGRFPPGIDLWAVLAASIALLLRPQSARLLLLLMAVSTISTWIQAPIASNHTIVRTAVLIGYWLSFGWVMISGRSWDSIFRTFAPTGQGALLVMYFFGIFHKINTDFLNPVSSCAVALWREMPPPLSWIDTPIMHDLAIYGTFVVEGGIVLMLLSQRLRHAGVVSGIAFHGLLALSGYAMYISFSMLAIALHTLFLSPTAASRIFASREMAAIAKRMSDPVYLIAAFLMLLLIGYVALLRDYTAAALLVAPIVVPFCWLVVRYGSESAEGQTSAGPRARWVIAGLVTGAFFANCMLPYAGLKTAQTINMFANLRLEAGVSNHLVFSSPPGPFRYLEDVAVIESADDAPLLDGYARKGYAMVYYDLLNALDRNPDARVTYVRNGVRFEGMTAADLQEDIETVLHHPWVRKWFHFQPVVLERPEMCNV